MKKAILFLTIGFAMIGNLYAHDEGHGPKLSDTGRFGGVVMPVIEAKDAEIGSKAKLVYKSELVRGEDGALNLYLYDQSMKALDLAKFGSSVSAKIGPMKSSSKWKTETFSLEKKGASFVGKLPTVKMKPFYIDLSITEGNLKLFTAFENLD